MRILILSLLLLFSCSGSVETEDLISNDIFIGQPGIDGFDLDNIEINYNEILSSRKISSDEVFISTRMTLSRFDTSSISIVIEGAYNDPLSQDDLNALASIGLTSVNQDSTKGHMRGISKNPSADIDLAYNIRISTSIYGNETLSFLIARANAGHIWVGGENHFNAQALQRVPDEDYFLFHEWQTNQLSAYQILPERNLRKISLGTPVAATQFGDIKFTTAISEVNDYPVGYTFSSEAGKTVYKITNDGSGINGWQFTDMGSGFVIDRWFETVNTSANGEGVLLAASKLGNNNEFMTIVEWDGSNWTFTDLGSAVKTAVGGTWVDANTYHSQPYKAADGTIWIALNEGSSPINDSDPLRPLELVNGYLIGMEYISGDPKLIGNWQFTRYDFSNDNNVFQSRIRNIYFSFYNTENDFVGYLCGDGIMKVSIDSSSQVFEGIAQFQGTDFLDLNQSFPESSGVIKNIKYIYNMAQVPQNSFEILFQGPTSIFRLDKRDNSITKVLMNTEGSVVKYSR